MSGEHLDVVGIGSMVVDRIHRTSRILAAGEKGALRAVGAAGPVQIAVGGVTLNHLGWASTLGLRTGIFGRQGDDEGGCFLRAAMDRLAIQREIVVVNAPTSLAEIFVDDLGNRSIYMAPGATSGTTPEWVREHHAGFIRRARCPLLPPTVTQSMSARSSSSGPRSGSQLRNFTRAGVGCRRSTRVVHR